MLTTSRHIKKDPLYVARPPFMYEQMIQHCLWKILSETGLIYSDQLTEMETIHLANLVKRKTILPDIDGDRVEPVNTEILNKAIDKIVCQVKALQHENQRYQVLLKENRKLKNGLNGLMKLADQENKFLHLTIDRSITEIGLSPRSVRILQSAGIHSLQELRQCSLARLKNLARVGVKTIHEIENALMNYAVQDSSVR